MIIYILRVILYKSEKNFGQSNENIIMCNI